MDEERDQEVAEIVRGDTGTPSMPGAEAEPAVLPITASILDPREGDTISYYPLRRELGDKINVVVLFLNSGPEPVGIVTKAEIPRPNAAPLETSQTQYVLVGPNSEATVTLDIPYPGTLITQHRGVYYNIDVLIDTDKAFRRPFRVASTSVYFA
jgi:hypothetical protein